MDKRRENNRVMGSYHLLMKQRSKRAKAEATGLLRPKFRNYTVSLLSHSIGQKATEPAQIQEKGKENHHSAGIVGKNLQPSLIHAAIFPLPNLPVLGFVCFF